MRSRHLLFPINLRVSAVGRWSLWRSSSRHHGYLVQRLVMSENHGTMDHESVSYETKRWCMCKPNLCNRKCGSFQFFAMQWNIIQPGTDQYWLKGLFTVPMFYPVLRNLGHVGCLFRNYVHFAYSCWWCFHHAPMWFLRKNLQITRKSTYQLVKDFFQPSTASKNKKNHGWKPKANSLGVKKSNHDFPTNHFFHGYQHLEGNHVSELFRFSHLFGRFAALLFFFRCGWGVVLSLPSRGEGCLLGGCKVRFSGWNPADYAWRLTACKLWDRQTYQLNSTNLSAIHPSTPDFFWGVLPFCDNIFGVLDCI